MANQDSGSIAIDGSLSSTALGSVRFNISVDFAGRLLANASGDSIVIGSTIYLLEYVYFNGTADLEATPHVANNSGLIDMSASLSSEVSYNIPIVSELLDFSGSLTSTVLPSEYLNSYVAFYGFGSLGLVEQGVGTVCSDLTINMTIQELISTGCSIGDSDMITRYRGDTYPIRTTLSRNGDYDISGHTFQMSTQIKNKTLYTASGTIIDANNGIVEFTFPAGSIDVAGTGVYDIEGNDGTYVYTYDKGVFELLDDVTV